MAAVVASGRITTEKWIKLGGYFFCVCVCPFLFLGSFVGDVLHSCAALDEVPVFLCVKSTSSAVGDYMR